MPKKHHRWRKWLIGLGVLVVALIAFRLYLPTLVQNYVNNKLDELPNYDGEIGDVDIHLWRGAYSIEDIRIVKTEGDVPVPFFASERVDLSIEWRELLHGAAVAEIQILDGHLNFVKGETAEESQTSIDDVWLQVVKDLFPFKINRFALQGGEIRFLDEKSEPKVDLFVTNVVAVATNLVNSRKFATTLPADFQIMGDTIGGGVLAMHMKLDPMADKPTFDLNFAMRGVDLTALNEMLEAYGKFNVKRGRMEIYSEMAASGGDFDGYVKPFIEDLNVFEFKQDNDNPVKMVWQGLVAGAMKLFKNQPQDQVATKIPISGSFDQPEVQIWTTVVNVLKNAFIQAFSPTVDESIDLFNRGQEDKSEDVTEKKREKEKKAEERQMTQRESEEDKEDKGSSPKAESGEQSEKKVRARSRSESEENR
ncbi:MAG: DUF748 domain-containing protein [Verrucomicrobiales bacterium]